MRCRALPLLYVLVLGSLGLLTSKAAQSQEFNIFGPSAFAPFSQPSDRPSTHITVRPSLRHNVCRGAGGQDFCVRSCDGRYFPVSASGNVNSKDFCKNFCPAAETKIYSGSTIDDAKTSEGKLYSKIANAFRFRKEFVSECRCHAAGAFGLAHVRIEDDKTIRVGDIVANANGLMVASREGRSGVIFTRIRAARLKAGKLPKVAARQLRN